LVILNRRETFFRATMLAYQDIYRHDNNIARVTIITTTALCDDMIERIKGLLKKQLNKELEFVYEIDPSLIGGFVLRVESMQLDASIQNELKKLRVKLLNK
jgi:F-type H+-transporting ATPase subunit delta